MKTKNVYKIGDKIQKEELQEVSKGIVKKALKVIETSGNRWATRIIEGQDKETREDLEQLVILELIENNYIITKECYRKINKYFNDYKVERVKNIEIVINEDTNASNIDKYSYISYIKEEKNVLEKKETIKKFNIEMLNLTEKQREILNIYSKINSMQGTAELLGISKGSVQKTIERIREKTQKLCYAMEF